MIDVISGIEGLLLDLHFGKYRLNKINLVFIKTYAQKTIIKTVPNELFF